MNHFAAAQEVADAVLYEGYALYPYRASDAKNAVRWQFGVLMPPAYVTVDPSERSCSRTQCLWEGTGPSFTARLRFLQVRNRVVEEAVGGGFRPVAQLDAGDTVYLPWDEAVEQTVDVALPGLGEIVVPFTFEGGVEVELLREAGSGVGAGAGRVLGRYVRRRWPLRGLVHCTSEPLPGPYGAVRVSVRVQNHSEPEPGKYGTRPLALRSALVAHHVLLAADRGRFLSTLDPPEWATGYAGSCENTGLLPVLVGEPGASLVLSSPIYLYDFPSVAPESRTTFFDATEIDEMLSLRAMTLTEQEKREARGTDPRTAALISDVDNLPADVLDRLHGAVRYLRAFPRPTAPADDELTVAGLRKGSRVRLRPGPRADAQDMFLEGRLATVAAVLLDVDGRHYLAVTVDDESGDVQRVHGRHLYFAPEEVEPAGGAE